MKTLMLNLELIRNTLFKATGGDSPDAETIGTAMQQLEAMQEENQRVNRLLSAALHDLKAIGLKCGGGDSALPMNAVTDVVDERDKLRHERQCLAEAIGALAVAMGDQRTAFTGPDLLMVCNDAVEIITSKG